MNNKLNITDFILASRLLSAVCVGDRVTISDRFGEHHTGRAVMRGPAGWVLNMGGPHGTPAIADVQNIVSLRRKR